jgi:hypothetical protein
VRLLLATNQLGLGGSESYLLTVAEHLQRLGHDVVVYAAERGRGFEVAAERGIATAQPGEMPGEFDAALVQDAAISYEVAEHSPEAPQLFVAHSEMIDLQSPPQIGEWVGTVVVMNDRVEARMRAYAARRPLVRLRQPIDTDRFVPRTPLPERPRRALLLSNTPHRDRVQMLEAAAAAAGIELVRLGGRDGQTTDPREALHGADVVIGYGRSVLEGMACGRAAYVYDWKGGDGWVTRESYPRIEADGFGGRSGEETIDAERLRADLESYDAAMGPVNYDLVTAHHRANVHAQELVGLLEGMGAPTPTPAPLGEMARLVRLEWRAHVETLRLSSENADLRGQLAEAHDQLSEAHAAARREAEKGEQIARGYEATLSWRLTAPLRAAGERLRRLRGRRG